LNERIQEGKIECGRRLPERLGTQDAQLTRPSIFDTILNQSIVPEELER